MNKTKQAQLKREKTSRAVRALIDAGFGNDEIASMLRLTRNQVGAVAAWHNNPNSWKK